MTRLGTSLVDCGGADQCAETPIAPNEMATIQTDGRFIGVAPREIGERAPATLPSTASRGLHETTGALQWEQMFVMIFMERLSRARRHPVAKLHSRECLSTDTMPAR